MQDLCTNLQGQLKSLEAKHESFNDRVLDSLRSGWGLPVVTRNLTKHIGSAIPKSQESQGRSSSNFIDTKIELKLTP